MRIVLVFVLAVVLGAGGAAAYFMFVEDEEPAPTAPRATATPSYEQRARLSERITRDRAGLAEEGIYLVGVTLDDSCARVSLLNPTPANIAYVEDRFPGACVADGAQAVEKTCSEDARGLTRPGTVEVPDVLDMRLSDASRRVLASDLVYSAQCPGDEETAGWEPSGPQDEQLRVIAQCPRPGERVRAGTEVALDAAVLLPGGFQHRIGALDEAATGTASPCSDGRNPRG